jgi:hypothetical protein
VPLHAGNDHDGEQLRFRAERILRARDLGMACFDAPFYRQSSVDLQVGRPVAPPLLAALLAASGSHKCGCLPGKAAGRPGARRPHPITQW